MIFRNMEDDQVVQDPKIDRLLNLAMPICFDIPRSKKHVSLILRKGKILSVGTNAFKGHPIARKIGYRFEEQHSELNAFLKCSEKDKLSLINIRFNKSSEMRMARPCSLCLPWCTAIFEHIYYTCPDGHVRELDSSRYRSDNLVSGILGVTV